MSGSNFLLMSIGIVLIVVLFILHQLEIKKVLRMEKQLREANEAIENTKKRMFSLESKDKDMTDSLIYAQRIQEALLPSEDYFRSYFKDSFVLFKPWDIVSGDFYWISENVG